MEVCEGAGFPRNPKELPGFRPKACRNDDAVFRKAFMARCEPRSWRFVGTTPRDNGHSILWTCSQVCGSVVRGLSKNSVSPFPKGDSGTWPIYGQDLVCAELYAVERCLADGWGSAGNCQRGRPRVNSLTGCDTPLRRRWCRRYRTILITVSSILLPVVTDLELAL